jgi:hypothetical protein
MKLFFFQIRPDVIRLSPGLLRDFSVIARLAEIQIIDAGSVIEIQKFIINPALLRIIRFRNQPGNIGRNGNCIAVFQNADTFIPLLDIKPVHKFICLYGFPDSLLQMRLI